jgi:hypothetical protein
MANHFVSVASTAGSSQSTLRHTWPAKRTHSGTANETAQVPKFLMPCCAENERFGEDFERQQRDEHGNPNPKYEWDVDRVCQDWGHSLPFAAFERLGSRGSRTLISDVRYSLRQFSLQ